MRTAAVGMFREITLTIVVSSLMTGSALAWGYEGHRVVAQIARPFLRPNVRQNVDAILASDGDALTAPDMASKVT